MLSAAEQKDIRALQRRRNREVEGRFVAEGIRVVEDLLDSELVVRLVVGSSTLEDSERGRALLERARRAGVPVRVTHDSDVNRLAGTDTPQGVLAVADIPRWTLEDLHGVDREVVLVLDAVQDPGNLGTLVRSAEALGVVGVIALTGTVDPWNPKSVRSAAGSSFRLPLVSAGWRDALDWLRRSEYTVLAAAAGGAGIPRATERVALVVGNEGSGISPEIIADVDLTVGIPLRGRAESLNVAAAAAILMYELTR